jgi:hypothetical protein
MRTLLLRQYAIFQSLFLCIRLLCNVRVNTLSISIDLYHFLINFFSLLSFSLTDAMSSALAKRHYFAYVSFVRLFHLFLRAFQFLMIHFFLCLCSDRRDAKRACKAAKATEAAAAAAAARTASAAAAKQALDAGGVLSFADIARLLAAHTHTRMQRGRRYAAVSLAEAAAVRAILHKRAARRQPFLPSSPAAAVALRIRGGSRLLDASKGYTLAPPPQRALATHCMRLFNSETSFASATVPPLVAGV